MSKKEELRALTKADPFLESLQRAGAFVRSHQTVVVASIVLFILVGAGVAFGVNRADKQAGAASKLLAEAQKTLDKMPATDMPAAEPPAGDAKEEKYATKDEWRAAIRGKLGAIIKDYPGSGAAKVSQLYLASVEIEAGNPAAAEQHYRAFLADSPPTDPMAASARLSLAAALEDQGKADEAIGVLKEVVINAPKPKAKDKDTDKEKDKNEVTSAPLVEEALLATARLQERSGKLADARETYERIKTELPASTARFKAEQRLSQMPKE